MGFIVDFVIFSKELFRMSLFAALSPFGLAAISLMAISDGGTL